MKVNDVMMGGIATALLAACAGGSQLVAPYRAPTAGATAKLIVEASVGPAVHFQLVSFSDAQHCTGGQLLATQADLVGDATFALLKAGHMSTLSFRTTAGMQCEVIGSFLPRAGRTYLLGAVDRGGRCGIQLDDITAGKAAETTFVSRTPQRGGCVAQNNLEKIMLAQAPSNGKAVAPSLDDFKDILPGK
jgi:hypothetical protein